jgi:hypothetical protein
MLSDKSRRERSGEALFFFFSFLKQLRTSAAASAVAKREGQRGSSFGYTERR